MKPKILIISHILPLPGDSGQKMRVKNTLKFLLPKFDVTYLSFCKKNEKQKNIKLIKRFSNNQIFLNSIYNSNFIVKIILKVFSIFYSILTGLKPSNFIIGEIEFSWHRLKKIVKNGGYDIVLVEYFYAYRLAKNIKRLKIPVALDTHNILWKSFQKQLNDKGYLPSILIKMMVDRYRKFEEYAWSNFDHVIAINENEKDYIRSVVTSSTNVSLSGMGVDMMKWNATNFPKNKRKLKKIFYYGSLNSTHNQRDALFAYFNIFKKLEELHSDVEFWIIGNNPPKNIIELGETESNVFVTGFVDKVEDVINKMDFAIIPWSGKYGFRSRIIEIMASGIPVLTSPDAVDGMMLCDGEGIFLCDSIEDFLSLSLKLIENNDFLHTNRELARAQVVKKWDIKISYRALANDLLEAVSLTQV